MIEILLLVLPVFLVIGLGYSLKGSGLADGDFLVRLNRLVYYVPLPIMFFYKIATADFAASFNPRLLAGIMTTIGVMSISSYLYAGVRKYDKVQRGTFSQAAFRGNLVFIALPIVYNAYGETGFAIAGIMIGFMTAVINFLSILVLLLPHRQEGHDLRASFWIHQIAFNPLIIASFSGIAWSFFRLPIPAVLANSFEIISGMTMPLALFVIGASFSFKELRGDITIMSVAMIFKLILMPGIAAGLFLLLGVQGVEFGVGILLTGAPAASAGYIMAQQLKGDADLASSTIMFTTLISVLSYTLYLYILKIAGI